MVDPAGGERCSKRLGDVLLPHHLGEGRGSVFAVEGERHGPRLRQRTDTGPRLLTTVQVRDKRGPPHPSELTDPCCLPALGGLMRWTPRGSGGKCSGDRRGFENKPARARAAPLEAACGDLETRVRGCAGVALDTASKHTSKIVETCSHLRA